MSIVDAQQCLRLALDSATPAERLGHLHAAQAAVKGAIKDALERTVEQDAGQEELPLTGHPTGPAATVDTRDGVVRTPADEQADLDAEDATLREQTRQMAEQEDADADAAINALAGVAGEGWTDA